MRGMWQVYKPGSGLVKSQDAWEIRFRSALRLVPGSNVQIRIPMFRLPASLRLGLGVP